MFVCSKIIALGACLTHNGLEKFNQIQRKVMAPLHVHVCNNKGMLTVACVASVSNRVTARKLEREQKKKVEGGGSVHL